MLCPHCNKPIVLELTVKERQVLNLISRGKSNKNIADEGFVTVQTIKNQVMTICHKLGAENRAHAVMRGVQQGLIDY